MNFNNFTIKSQEVVQKGVEIAQQAHQQQIEHRELSLSESRCEPE